MNTTNEFNREFKKFCIKFEKKVSYAEMLYAIRHLGDEGIGSIEGIKE